MFIELAGKSPQLPSELSETSADVNVLEPVVQARKAEQSLFSQIMKKDWPDRFRTC